MTWKPQTGYTPLSAIQLKPETCRGVMRHAIFTVEELFVRFHSSLLEFDLSLEVRRDIEEALTRYELNAGPPSPDGTAGSASEASPRPTLIQQAWGNNVWDPANDSPEPTPEDAAELIAPRA